MNKQQQDHRQVERAIDPRWLFCPSSIAIIGASADPMRIGGRPIDYMRRANYPGKLFPVNPKYSEIQGYTCYSSILNIPSSVDLAVIALPAKSVPCAVSECLQKEVKAMIIYSSGFAESDAAGKAIQVKIRKQCEEAGILLLGPNCLGVMDVRAGVMLTFSTILENIWPKQGTVSVISQSGAVGAYSAAMVMERGLGLATWVSTGNEACIDVARCIEWLAEEQTTSLIMAYMEGCTDTARLRHALSVAARNGKPVIMLKSGLTEVGKRAVAAHTGTDPGENYLYDDIFRSTGTLRVSSIEEQVDLVYACANGVFPRGRNLCIITISGGVGILLADAAHSAGLELPPNKESNWHAIKKLVPFSIPANPVDVTAQVLNDISILNQILEIQASDPSYDTLIIFIQQLGKTDQHFQEFCSTMLEEKKKYPEKLFVLCGGFSAHNRSKMETAGFLVFEEPQRAITAIAGLVQFSQTVVISRQAIAAGPSSNRGQSSP
jgi:acyl-CoA synthetase (NDP forming)